MAEQMKSKTDHILHALADRVNYDSRSGRFLWKLDKSRSSQWNSRCAGKPAGSIGNAGYLMIGIHVNGVQRRVLAHRLAFFMTHGRCPIGDVDHIDGDKLNNSSTNLREVSISGNLRNKRMYKNNTSGFTGVSLNKGGRWLASAARSRRPGDPRSVKVKLGTFATKEEAVAAVLAFRSANGYTERHGLPASPASSALVHRPASLRLPVGIRGNS